MTDEPLESKISDLLGDALTKAKGKGPVKDFESRRLAVKLMDGTVITGRTNLRNNTRLIDLFNRETDLFIVIFDAAFREEEDQVVFVNKNQIMWAMPVDD